MQTYVEQSQTILDVASMLDMEPDILALAAYLAQRRNLALGEFLEHLITSDLMSTGVTSNRP